MTGIRKLLVPQYIENIPDVDGWKKPFVYYLDPSTVQKRNVMAIFSGGRDTVDPSGTYTVSNFDPTDYDQDVIWADGFFVRWPQK